MQPTVYQKPELRDANDNIIQQGAFGKNTALANSTNDGWIDYVANNLEFLYDLAKDEVVPVPALPASGQTNKTYLLTTTGVSYRWSGTEWVAVSSSEAVGRAESAALLAEQWATKTDGTVDGTEYSAKYYAEQAEASADDAQDVADDMATHLVQIDKNTGGVAKNSKRIGNIEKLLQGNLYDYDTDDDVAYTKTVPSGALPYAGIEKLGGKTVVWNQLASLDGLSAQTSSGVTLTPNANGSWTISGTATGRVTTTQVVKRFDVIAGHKYYFGLSSSLQDLRLRFGSSAMNPQYLTDSGILECVSGVNLYAYLDSAVDISSTIDMTLFITIHDLTLMYGSGNEPSTVQEFEAMFPADYYPYNAGTLLSAGVTGVRSQSKNLAYYGEGLGEPSNTTFANTTKRIFEVGKYVKGLSYNNYYNSPYITTLTVADNSITIINDHNSYGMGIPFNCLAGESYVVSYNVTNGGAGIGWYAEDGTYISGSASVTSGNALTVPANARQGVLVLRPTSANTTATYSNVQIEHGTTASIYVPAKAPIQYPIPAEVRALEGYGWSDGTAYNYVDLERKVYVQNVAQATFDGSEDEAWTLYSTTEARYAFRSYGYMELNKAYLQIINNRDIPVKNTSTATSADDNIVTMRSTNYVTSLLYIFAPPTQWADLAAFKAWLSANPLTIQYPLATPIETDISQYLTDNLIEVGAGGTLTFPNSNGDDYHIPVPSTETYMIDLQEAIENGN